MSDLECSGRQALKLAHASDRQSERCCRMPAGRRPIAMQHAAHQQQQPAVQPVCPASQPAVVSGRQQAPARSLLQLLLLLPRWLLPVPPPGPSEALAAAAGSAAGVAGGCCRLLCRLRGWSRGCVAAGRQQGVQGNLFSSLSHKKRTPCISGAWRQPAVLGQAVKPGAASVGGKPAYLLLLCHQLCDAGLCAVRNSRGKLLKHISHLQGRQRQHSRAKHSAHNQCQP